MPSVAGVTLPKPSDWKEFEKICLSSCKLRWNSQSFTMHGRQGQVQYGVDIYGQDSSDEYIGIQCKNTLGGITKKTIATEVENAENFSPVLKELYIATTSPSDVYLQKYVRELSHSRSVIGKFTVRILFWSEIVQDLSKDINEIKRFYSEFFDYKISRSLSFRERDIVQVTELLNIIDIDSINYYLSSTPKYVQISFVENTDYFLDIIRSPIFHIYDETLDEVLNKWLNKWLEIASLMRKAPYKLVENRLIYIMPGDYCRNEKEHSIYNKLDVMFDDYWLLLKDFCDYLYHNYPEIDLKITSATARTFGVDGELNK